MAPRPRKKARSSCSPWPALPSDIAGEVLRRLPSYADRICFGAVCRSWRSSAAQHPLPPRLPCLVFTDGTFRGFPEDDRPFRLPAAGGYHGSCGEWLVFQRDGGGYSLVNPFSKEAAVAPLPSLSSVRACHEPVAAVRERAVSEYDVHGLLLRGLDDADELEPEPQTVSLRKLVMFPLTGVVAAVIGKGRLGKLALCCPGAPSWSVSSRVPWRRLKDMVMHQGTLYAVDHNEDLLAVTIGEDRDGTPAVTGIRRAIRGAPPSFSTHRRVTLHYLVETGGALLMVRREVCRARPGRGKGMEEWFTVFEADFRSSRWEKVSTLGDGVALFVGRWCSGAVRVRRKHWADLIFFLQDGGSDQRLRYSLSAYHVSFPTTYVLLPVMMSRDGDDLPATWLFPQHGTCTSSLV